MKTWAAAPWSRRFQERKGPEESRDLLAVMVKTENAVPVAPRASRGRTENLDLPAKTGSLALKDRRVNRDLLVRKENAAPLVLRDPLGKTD